MYNRFLFTIHDLLLELVGDGLVVGLGDGQVHRDDVVLRGVSERAITRRWRKRHSFVAVCNSKLIY